MLIILYNAEKERLVLFLRTVGDAGPYDGYIIFDFGINQHGRV